MGRRAQLALFTENLAKDPESETDPAEFLFHVRGVGGVGKSTLVRQWQEAARRAGAVTAVVDENDVHGVPQTLTELAAQLAVQAGPLKEFDRAAEQYRRELEAAAEPLPAAGSGRGGGEVSASSRIVAQAAFGAASLLPGAGVITAMASPDTAALGLDRLRQGVRPRGRGERAAEGSVSRAFVSELARLGGRHPWVVLFLDTWEQTGRSLDGWLRELLADGHGPLPPNVMVVLAGRDELAERDWAPLRAWVADVPLEVFTETETRALLTARGATDPDVVDAVLRLSMGLPLLVELLALARPGSSADVDAGGDVVDVAVDRFVQWITEPGRRETVLACALAPQLNEDVFAAAAPDESRETWDWLCAQPFVRGHGDFRQYHAVVRASMVRRQRANSPQRWTAAHLRLAGAYGGWRAAVEAHLPTGERWGDARWRRHRLDETYHLLCAAPADRLADALKDGVHAAGQGVAALRQWTDVLEQAADDSADPGLLSWAGRLRRSAADDAPNTAALTALLTHGRLGPAARSWAHAYRGRHLYLVDRDDEALSDLDRATAADPGNAWAWAWRGDLHLWHDRHDEAVSDLTTAIGLDPGFAWALGFRGMAHREAGRYDQAVTDLDAALAIDPGLAWVLGERGSTHRQAERYDEAVADLTAALALDPEYVWALSQRGEAHRQADRPDQAVTDFTTALALNPENSFVLGRRGMAHREAGRYDQAVTDLDAALALDPELAWVFSQRGEAHRQAGRYGRAVSDFTAALALIPEYAFALSSRGQAHRQAGRPDEAVPDLTAALGLSPGEPWTLAERGTALRQAGRLAEAREDLEAAVAGQPDDVRNIFELTLLNTAESGFDALAVEQWTRLLHMPPDPADDDDSAPFLALFRALLLDLESDVAAATAEFLAGVAPDTVTEAHLYTREIAALDGVRAERARRCHELLARHLPR
ncbi:tetratricopeptide repeat protein [Streptomyces sp. NPDC051940]|uniref:tetratricopeptide repeat protein n=1 Tax=Streptomyces sp. NPDC051940 TaxID=3155675 RepID=UPI00342B1640